MGTEIQHFLDQIGFSISNEEMEVVEACFLQKAEQGLLNDNSSVPMLPSYLTFSPWPTSDKHIITIDAGGTHLRVCLLLMKSDRRYQVLYQNQCDMPGKKEIINKKEFFDRIAEMILPVACESHQIGLCFSFNCRSLPDRDSIVISLDKEFHVSDIAGAKVGECLRLSLAGLGAKGPYDITVLNDSVAALLGASAIYGKIEIGLIIGTGFNICYLEQNSHIKKDHFLPKDSFSSIINTEAGSFCTLPVSFADRMLSQILQCPDNNNLLEKMIGGEYQGTLLEALIILAARKHLIHPSCEQYFLTHSRIISGKDVNLIVHGEWSECQLHIPNLSLEDMSVILSLAEAIQERAAEMIAMCLTAISHHLGKERTDTVQIAVEGSTYCLNDKFRNRLDQILQKKHKNGQAPLFRFVSGENTNLLGCAIAVCSAPSVPLLK